jgi:tetratricopeptide (TPR) repeat protein
MAIIYRVAIEATTRENIFRIQWTNPKNKILSFDQPASDITPEEVEWMWKDRRNQLKTGEKLFRFLDGDNHHLEQALKEADNYAETLQVHLYTCRETSNWPFELLAENGSFLLPDRLHLVRSIPAREAVKELTPPPQNRRLRLLFIACSPLDVKQELDFEKEEEAIFKITEKLAIDMEVEDTGSLEGLWEKLEHRQYDIVHLSGYAGIDKKGQPFFVMENETGHRVNVSAEELWQKGLMVNPPRLLFISGNSTGDAPEGTEGAFAHMLIEKYQIPAVLGWGRWISDSEANEAAQVIYKELSRGKSVLDAVQRARYELHNSFKSVLKPAWPQLRFFCSGGSLDAMVTAEQKRQPQTRRMTHVYLKNSEVKVLLEGFVGRRRQLQQSIRALTQIPEKVGLLILGTGGLGKSCLAGKISERFKENTLIIIHGKLNSITLKQALKDAFIVAWDDHGKKVLTWEMELKDILGILCRSCFKDKKYLILLDDFEQNLISSEKGKPDRLLPEAAELLKVLLDCLPGTGNTGKTTRMMITCRYGFSMTVKDLDLIKERLEWIWLARFREPEQKKKVGELPHILKQKELSTIDMLLAAGCGNPRLMEWIDVLVGEMDKSGVTELLQAVSGKKQDFIQKHVIRELLKKGGDDLTQFLQWFAIYRRPVLKEGAKEVGEKAGLKRWEDLLHRGMDLSLIEHDHARLSYQGTPLLCEEFLKELDDLHACHEAAFTYYKNSLGDKSIAEFDPLLVEEWIYHALNCEEEEVVSILGGKLLSHLRKRLAFQEARQVGEWILSEKKQQCSTSDDASLLNEIAMVIDDLGNHRQAIEYWRQALAIEHVEGGKENPNAATMLMNIGTALKDVGEPSKSVDYLEKALAIDWAVYGYEHPHVARDLFCLGSICFDIGEFNKAINYDQQALTIWKKCYGEKHPYVTSTLDNLGSAYKELGDHQQAIMYYKEALSLNLSLYGEEHISVATTLNNLGLVYHCTGEADKAVIYFQQALQIDRTVFGEEHPDVATTLNNLGGAQQDLGELKIADDCYQKALSIDLKAFGENHPNIARDLNNLGFIWHISSKPDKAIDFYQQALDIYTKVYGETHPTVATTSNNIGEAWRASNDSQKAILYYEKALSINRTLYGGDFHPDAANYMNNLGLAYLNLNKLQQAKDYIKMAYDIFYQILGPEHPNTKTVGESLEVCLQRQAKKS